MEDVKKIHEFLSIGSGSGSGYGDGDGDGSGYGYGSGYGSGDGSGYGSGYGYGYGYGYGIAAIAGERVYLIDEVQTLIDMVRWNIAKGRILMSDLTTKACYIIKQNNLFAHGETLREARAALEEKLFDGMSEGERIEAFMAEHKLGVSYANRGLYDWHHRLTESCDMGRKAFAQDHGIDLNASMTVEEFIELTKDAYGGDIIRKLAERYMEGQ